MYVWSDAPPPALRVTLYVVSIATSDNTNVALVFVTKVGSAILDAVIKLLVIIHVSCTVSIS